MYTPRIMQKVKLGLTVGAVAILLIGFGIILWTGRPASPIPIAETANDSSSTETPVDTNSPVVYTMADVEAHAVKNDCWTTIHGGVYDLTTWVSRHPGGENAIIKLCGTDGSESYTRKHGDNPIMQAALVLLKIGELQK